MGFNEIWLSEFNISLSLYNQLTVIIPSTFLFIVLPIQICYLSNSHYRNIPWTFINCSKIFFTISFLIITTLLWFTKEDWIILSVNAVTLILSIIITIYNKIRGIRSSGILFIYWTLIWLLSLSEFINFLSNLEIKSLNTIFSNQLKFQTSEIIITCLSFILLCLQSFSDGTPKISKYPKTINPSPENSCGFLSRTLFNWFNFIIYKHQKTPLTEKSVWELDYEYTSKMILPHFEKYWITTKMNISSENKSLLKVLIKAFGLSFIFTAILRFIMNIIYFIFPMILRKLILFAESDKPTSTGLVYAFFLMLLSLLLTFIMNYYMHKSSVIGLGIQTSLINSIYKKTLRVSGYDKSDIGKITDLIAIDCRGFITLIPLLNMIWAAPFTILITIYFLKQEFDWLATFIGFIVLSILMIPTNKIVAKKIVEHQKTQMKNKDKKMKHIIELLNGIKVIKLCNWESHFQKFIENIRNDEMTTLRKMEFWNSGKYFITIMTPFLVSLSTFVTYILIDEKNILTIEKVFVALSLFNIIQYPLSLVSILISTCAKTWVSIKRIEDFLNKPESETSKIEVDTTMKFSLRIENGTFCKNEQIILQNINCVIPKGQSVAIVGSVGSGKSSLLLAILGELQCKSGSIRIFESMTYLPQQAWIQQATLESNILFGKTKNDHFYEEVIEACALKQDIDEFPNGDQTIIGEKGINLSGGQKQRVSLARAIYSDTSIYLFDDPLSSVDTHVANHIFNNVIGPNGILANKTRLFVTNNIRHTRGIDIIIGLEDGKITDKKIEDICNEDNGDDVISNADEEEQEEDNQNEITKELTEKINIENDDSENHNNQEKPLLLKEKPKIIEDERMELGKVSYHVYLEYFKSIGWVLVFIIFVLNVISHCTSIYSNFWLSKWASNNSTDSNDRQYYIIGFTLIGLGQSVALSLTCILLAIGCLNAAKLLHTKLLSQILKLPLLFFEKTPSGRIINRFSRDINSMDEILPTSIRDWLSVTLMIILILILWIATVSYFILIPVLFILLIYLYILNLHLSISRQLRRLESVTKSPIHSHFTESVTGSLIIKTSNQEERFIKELEDKVDHNHKFTYFYLVASRWLSVRLELLAIIIIYVVSIFLVCYRDIIPVTIFSLCLNYCLQIIAQLNQLVRTTSALETNIIAIERIREYIELHNENESSHTGVISKEGDIEIKEICVNYENNDFALRNLTINIKQGEKIGITGRTGSGKSTLASCLMRSVKLASGSICLNKENIENVSLEQLRTAITMVPQDIVLFSGTLRMNLDPLNKFNDQEIWHVLELVNMKTFVKNSTDKIYLEITDEGNNLSLGQKQLICLARGLLRKTKIFILDEITSAIDSLTEKHVQNLLNLELAGVTVITIAHRIQSLKNCDRIIVLDKGHIVESGLLPELLNNHNSRFYSLAKESGYFNNVSKI